MRSSVIGGSASGSGACDLDLDIARREVDMGVRNRRPDQSRVAGRRIGHVEYAVYAADAGVAGWIGPSRAASETPSMRRVRERHGGEAVTRANSPRLAAALARAGAGRVVLPMFAGARMIGLARVSEPIAVPRSEQWLVSHHDARGEPAIRAAPYAIGSHLERRD